MNEKPYESTLESFKATLKPFWWLDIPLPTPVEEKEN